MSELTAELEAPQFEVIIHCIHFLHLIDESNSRIAQVFTQSDNHLSAFKGKQLSDHAYCIAADAGEEVLSIGEALPLSSLRCGCQANKLECYNENSVYCVHNWTIFVGANGRPLTAES